jgi:hypothetical protein
MVSAYSIKVGHFISNLFVKLRLLEGGVSPPGPISIFHVALWLPFFFSKGHNFHIQSRFQCRFFLTTYFFKSFSSRPLVSTFKSVFSIYFNMASHGNPIWKIY